MPKTVSHDRCKDENNNVIRKFEVEEELIDSRIKKGNNDKDFYDLSSEDESAMSDKVDKSESSEEEEHSNDAETKEMKAEERCAETAEGKPTQSYISLIAKAILSSPKRKMVLSDIYQYILDNYPFYKTKDKSWRNSIRHNLSLNECFVKAGRSENGKGNYWAIHPSNIEDFAKGDYRRRRARRKMRRPSHALGIYSECFQPYTILSPVIDINKKLMPCLWGGYERRNSTGQKMGESPQKQRPRKSFMIESILGLDKDKKVDPCNSGTFTEMNSRRHNSTPSYNYQRSARYEGSAFSPIYRTTNIFDYYPSYRAPLECNRAPDHLPYTMFSTRDSVHDFTRSRQSFS